MFSIDFLLPVIDVSWGVGVNVGNKKGIREDTARVVRGVGTDGVTVDVVVSGVDIIVGEGVVVTDSVVGCTCVVSICVVVVCFTEGERS